MEGSNSPIKGLERLSDDLRQERQKATIALQDRARLRVEVESLKGTVLQLQQDLKDCRQFMESNDQHREQLHGEVTILLSEKQEMVAELHQLRDKLSHADSDINTNHHERDKAIEDMKLMRSQVNSLQSSHAVIEAKLHVKEQQLHEYISEIEKLRHAVTQSDEKENRTNSILLDRLKEIDELSSRIQQAEVVKESYHQHLLSSEEIKRELEKSMSNSLFISQQLRESSHRLSEQHAYAQDLEVKLQRVSMQNEALASDKHELECAVEELSARVRAEAEMASTEQQRADACARAKEYLEKQVHELRQAHSGLADANHRLEQLLSEATAEISSLNSELIKSSEREAEKDIALEAAQQSQSMASEVEFLRAQLGEVRKQLIRRGIEEEASVLTPKTLMERENHSRQVYEGIILELRTDLDRANNKYHEVARRLEESKTLAIKFQQLEEEVQMYRDTARAAAVESQR
jgi:chromosome segregation ATPase